VVDYCGRGETIVIKRLGALILVAAFLVGCSPFESYPKQQTTTTTTTTCPPGTQLQSDGMCR
jgi:PBP1b-binding outer membrane lipoprotein LpoB